MVSGTKLPKLIKLMPDGLIALQDLLNLSPVGHFTPGERWIQPLLLDGGVVSRWAAHKPAFENK